MVSSEARQRNERLFISVARPDRPWARWIGQELRRSGYEVELDEWSWRVGTSFVDRMERAIAAADRMIAVLSPAYFARESYGREEREAALRRAHDRDGFLIPVLVEPCNSTPIVGRLSHIDLTGRDETTARQLLVQGVRGPQPPDLDEDMPWPGRPPATPGETLESNPFPGTPVTAAHGTPDRAVVVFHPSELRLGRQDGLGEVIGTDAFMQALCDDIKQLGVHGEWVPNLLVLTGDLAEHGRRSEYGLASRLLEGLLARLQLEWHRVGIIPGEKDVNMAACRSYFEACAAEEVEPTAPYWPKWRFFEEMFAAVYRTPSSAAFAVGQEWSLFEISRCWKATVDRSGR